MSGRIFPTRSGGPTSKVWAAEPDHVDDPSPVGIEQYSKDGFGIIVEIEQGMIDAVKSRGYLNTHTRRRFCLHRLLRFQ